MTHSNALSPTITKQLKVTSVSSLDQSGSTKMNIFKGMVWNCQREGEIPDWSKFSGFVIQACMELQDEYGDSFIEAWDGEDETVCFWTVYGQHNSPDFTGFEALHDCDTEDEAKQLLQFCEQHI